MTGISRKGVFWRTVLVSPDKPEPISKPARKPKSLLKARLLSPFHERYRARYAMSREPVELREVFPYCLMTGDRKLLFLKNSKAGCTSVSQLLVNYSTGSFSADVHEHREGVFQHLYKFTDFRAGFDSPDTFCFSMTRNPLERFLSGFFDFFVDGSNHSAPKYLPAIKDRGYVVGGDIQRNLSVFVDFVEEAVSESRLECDQHWREQHVSIGYGKLPYDYIAKLENYDRDIRHVFESAGLGDFLCGIDWKRAHNKSSRSDLTVPAKMVSRIEQVYALDYELFGY
jgi:sulfotransferase famil protein